MKRRKFLVRFESAPPRPRRFKKDHKRIPSSDHQGHTPCPECGQFLVMAHAPRCFRCEPKDPVFELLDTLIAANVQYSRQYLEMHPEACVGPKGLAPDAPVCGTAGTGCSVETQDD